MKKTGSQDNRNKGKKEKKLLYPDPQLEKKLDSDPQ